MNKSDALRILIAAEDDPVLASWAAVAHEHKHVGDSDISPYEFWEAFQKMFDYGLISPDQFNRTDPRQAFFSGKRFSDGAIQRVLHNLKLLPERSQQEPVTMSSSKIGNPFGNDNALVARGSTAINGRNGHGPPLPAARQSLEIDSPLATRDALADRRSLDLAAFSPQVPSQINGLPCHDPAPPKRRLGQGSDLGRFGVTCVCGDPISMDIDDMIGAEGPDDAIPGGQVAILARVMHGTCRRCGITCHASIGTIDMNDVDR